MDKLRAIGFFCRVVEAKTFAAAAQSLDVVPSALSKAIAALENELGFKLINRSTRRLALTDEGSAYFEHCRRIMQDLEEAEVQAREGRTRAKGTLRIGLHPAFRSAVLTQISRFLDANPDVKLETTATNSPGAVLDDGLDLVIRIGRLFDSNLVARQLGSASFVVCAAPSYIAAWGEPQHPRELAKHRAIIYGRRDEDSNTCWEFVKGAERLLVDVPVRLVSRDGIGLIDAAIGAGGIARPYAMAAQHFIAGGQLRLLLPQWLSDAQPVHVVLPPNSRALPAKVSAFIEFFDSVLSGSQQ